ncbi:hypothetical protein R80B4_01755 [Fibrobacteres bacterium R8-0-B4]
MSTIQTKKMSVKAILFITAVFAASAFSQSGMDTAKVPIKVNVAATVDIAPPTAVEGVGVTKAIAANKLQDTLIVFLAKTLPVSYNPQTARPNIPAVVKGAAGTVTLNLSVTMYGDADIALYTVGGKRVLHGGASASSAVNTISHPNLAPGTYLISVKGLDGNAFTTRHTHSGGSLNVNVEFGRIDVFPFGCRSLRKESLNTALDHWTITATAAGYTGESRTFTPVKGINPLQTITLSPIQADTAGFVPEVLGLGVGAVASEQRFVWFSDSTAANNKSFVRIFKGNDIVSTDSGEIGGASKGKRFHKVTSSNLSPNTEYRYSVSNNKTDWSRKYSFKTPGTGAFKFAVAGDMHQGYIPDPGLGSSAVGVGRDKAIYGWDTTMRRISSHNVNFIASMGDHVDTADHDDLYKPFFAPAPMKNIPMAVAMGNHDINNLFIYHFNLPNTAKATNTMISYSPMRWYGSYWYLYNNTLFVVLNTGAYLLAVYNNESQDKKMAEARNHISYFDTVITKAKNAHAGKYDWLMVYHHKSTESIASHATEEEIKIYKDAGFEPLMDKHNVDLVIAGHDHIYVRTKPMRAGKSVTTGGTVYLTLPTASYTKFYPETDSLTKKEYVAKYKKNNFCGWPGYGIVNVNGKSVSAIIYNYNTGTNASYCGNANGGADVGLDTLTLSK